MYNEVINLVSSKSNILFDEPMSTHTTFRVGGKADCFAIANSEDDMTSIISYAKEKNVPIFIIGNGSNLLVGDNGIRGIVLKLGQCFQDIEVDGNTIIAGAAALVSRVAQVAQENLLTGLEWAYGIPGSVGGAVFMNAGAYGGEMSQVIVETTYLDKNMNLCRLKENEHDFGYRRSAFNNGKIEGVILKTKIKLETGNKDEILAKMQEHLAARVSKQPLDMPSAGSVFKRPEGAFVGQMVEELGLKGYSIGGAQVSTKHAGFIVNTGNATAKDIKDLIKYIQERVKERYNKDLITEVKEVGE